MIGTDGVKYKLNRIMRVDVIGTFMQRIEYCPYDNEQFNAHIEATIKYVPIIQNKNGRPGFSADIVIYNPPPKLIELIGSNISWPIGLANGSANQQTVEQYYAMRCKVKVDAGYWEDGKRDYTNLFDGHLNTSAYYRKGTDNILRLMCHNIKLSPSDMNRMTEAAAVSESFQQAIYNQVNADWGEGTEDNTWAARADLVIRTYETQKAPKVSAYVDDPDKQMTITTTMVTAEDRRQKGAFYRQVPIMPPTDLVHPGNGSTPDYVLANQLERTIIQTFVPHGNNFEAIMQELVDSFPGPLRWKADYDFTDGLTRYYFWLAEGGTGSSDDSAQVIKHGDVVIYNFQNLIEAPSVDGAGCFTVKMMFNPQVWPNKALWLKWDDSLSFGNIAPLTQGVATTSSIGQFYPSLQAGKYQAQVYANTYKEYAKANGYLFNEPYIIAYVTHKLSSRGNSWSTEAKTVSRIAQTTKE